jgi:hypothetical protein
VPDAGTINKQIREEFILDTRKADRSMSSLGRRAQRLGMTFGKLKRTVSGLGRTLSSPFAVLGVGGAIGGLTALTRHLVGVARETENTDMRIASLLQSAARVSGAPWKTFGEASGLAKQMRLEAEEIAVKFPGTADDIIEGLEGIVFATAKAGKSPRVMLEMARDIAVLQKTAGLAKGVVGRDIRDILSGRFVSAQIQTPVLKEGGKRIAELAKEDVGAAIVELQKLIKVPQAQIEEFGRSIEGKIGTAEMLFKQFSRKAAEPVMTFLIEKLDEAFEWFQKNREEAEKIAREVGEGIVDAIKTVVRLSKFVFDNWEAIAAAAASFATVSLVKAVAQMGQLVVQAGAFVAQLLRGKAIAATTSVGGGGVGRFAKGAARALPAIAIGIAGKELLEELDPTHISVEEIARRKLAEQAISGQAAFVTSLAFAQEAGQNVNPSDPFFFLRPPEEQGQLTGDAAGQAAAKMMEKSFAPTPTAKEEEKKKRKRGGGGRRRERVRTLEVDRIEFRGDSLARMASPLVLGVQQRAAIDRPLSATIGLGGLRVPNGR